MIIRLIYCLYKLRKADLDFGEPFAELEGKKLFAREEEEW